MKKLIILSVLIFMVFSYIYPKIVATVSEVGKVTQMRINGKHLFISDQKFVYAYELNTFKIIKKLNKIGEGPGEFKNVPVVEFSEEKLILTSSNKIAIINKSFKYISEIRLGKFMGPVVPIGNNFIIKEFKYYGDEKYDTIFSMINKKAEKIKKLVTVPHGPHDNYFFLYFPRARSCKDRLYIAQPHKGLYIDVFDNKGNFLYKINRKIKKIKAENKHKQLANDEMLFLVGKRIFERYKKFGTYKKPLQKYLPEISNFWVIDDNIYIKTYDFKEKKEKYIIMDLKGNIKKYIFLPIAYGENFTFCNNTFYYIIDSDKNEDWEIHAIKL